MDLDEKFRESKIELIRQFLSKTFNQECSRDEALNFVVESFHSRYFEDISRFVKENGIKDPIQSNPK